VVNAAADAGLIVRLVPANSGSSHEEIIRNVVKPTEGRTEKRSFNGLPATFFSGARLNAQGQLQNIQLSVVTGPASRFYLLQHAAKDSAARQRASSGLAQAEASFRALSSADRAAAQPLALRTAVMPRGGFAVMARGSADPARAEAQLRLLNGVYGGGAEPAVGSVVKMVR
jgi:predicted Zn-dependent protease